MLSLVKQHQIQEGETGVSMSTDGQRNVPATLLIEVGYFFQKEEGTSFNNFVNKKYIVKSE